MERIQDSSLHHISAKSKISLAVLKKIVNKASDAFDYFLTSLFDRYKASAH